MDTLPTLSVTQTSSASATIAAEQKAGTIFIRLVPLGPGSFTRVKIVVKDAHVDSRKKWQRIPAGPNMRSS